MDSAPHSARRRGESERRAAKVGSDPPADRQRDEQCQRGRFPAGQRRQSQRESMTMVMPRCTGPCGIPTTASTWTERRHPDIVKSLLKHGADPNLRIRRTSKGRRRDQERRECCYRRRAALTVTEIVLQGATPLVLAAEVNNLDVIKALVEAGADPNIRHGPGHDGPDHGVGRRHGRPTGERT